MRLTASDVDRPHHLVEQLAPRGRRLPRHALEQRVPPRLGQRPAQLRLEEDDEGQNPERPEVLEHERQAPEVRLPRGETGGHQEPEAGQHLDRDRAPEHEEDAVEHEGDDGDVQHVAQAEPGPAGGT